MDISVLAYRAVQDSDIPFLLRLRKDTMEEHLLRAGISVSEKEHLARIKYQFTSTRLIMWDEDEIGMIKIHRKEEHLEIIQFQILKAFRGKGLGKKVLADILKEALQQKLSVYLSVLKGNKAKSLYEQMGFFVIDETEDSWVMQT